ncbi:hypothetical protein HNP81_003010 [Peribacillus huizhouensis]|uniref:Uncharacterized protein n=1 Tax=Peribacillus huizhouensis TaxID=1501239 RepID=A0ABR6CRR5_9BACI|nr:hypothetical protein [Peribacillus huizhouensis]
MYAKFHFDGMFVYNKERPFFYCVKENEGFCIPDVELYIVIHCFVKEEFTYGSVSTFDTRRNFTCLFHL